MKLFERRHLIISSSGQTCHSLHFNECASLMLAHRVSWYWSRLPTPDSAIMHAVDEQLHVCSTPDSLDTLVVFGGLLDLLSFAREKKQCAGVAKYKTLPSQCNNAGRVIRHDKRMLHDTQEASQQERRTGTPHMLSLQVSLMCSVSHAKNSNGGVAKYKTLPS